MAGCHTCKARRATDIVAMTKFWALQQATQLAGAVGQEPSRTKYCQNIGLDIGHVVHLLWKLPIRGQTNQAANDGGTASANNQGVPDDRKQSLAESIATAPAAERTAGGGGSGDSGSGDSLLGSGAWAAPPDCEKPGKDDETIALHALELNERFGIIFEDYRYEHGCGGMLDAWLAFVSHCLFVSQGVIAMKLTSCASLNQRRLSDWTTLCSTKASC